MSLTSYLDTLQGTAALPPALLDQAFSADAFSFSAIDGTATPEALEAQASAFESLTDEQPADTLAGRTVLTLAGLAEIRYAGRLLVAHDAAEQAGGIVSFAAGEPGADAVLAADPDTDAIVAAIRQAADYDPVGAAAAGGDAAAIAFGVAPADLGVLEKDLQASVDAIVGDGESAVRSLAGAVGWQAVAGVVGGDLSKVVERSAMLAAARAAVGRAKQAILRVMEAGIAKLEKAVGPALGAFLGKAKDKLAAWFGSGGKEKLEAALVGAGTVVPACLAAVKAAGATDAQVGAAAKAGEAVAAHAHHLSGVTAKVAGVVKWFGSILWSSPVGPYVAAGFVVAIAAAVWQVQDHLDTSSPFPLPDVTEGMVSAVTKAIQQA
ncbi:MAG TPA: hypothetical protein VFJ85_18400 [Acidimicrobiales bacterium]|nr:hypothetical protein [Acidimicrobiales bacterium]